MVQHEETITQIPGAGTPSAIEVQELSWAKTALVRRHLLSPGQRIVLGCLAIGMDIKATATALDRSERTVKAHTSEIMNRLGVDSRLKAGIIGYHLLMRGELALPEMPMPKGPSTVAERAAVGS